jgi:agmatine/peptidylarginine deiminase
MTHRSRSSQCCRLVGASADFLTAASQPCYLNAHVCKGAVVTGKFGDAEQDAEALKILQRAFPERDIRMLSIDHIAAGGGRVHCLTQPMAASSR